MPNGRFPCAPEAPATLLTFPNRGRLAQLSKATPQFWMHMQANFA